LKDFGGCKDTLLKSLSDFLKTIISTNLATPDFHAGNILVKEANNDFVFYLIDVHRCKFTRTTSYAHIIYMLSFFIHSIYQNFQTSQLVRFIKNCLPEDTDLANTCRIILNQFRKIYHRHRTRRTLRCLHNNPDFCVIKEDAKYFLPSSASLETMKNILRELPGYQVVKRVKNRTIYVNNTYFIKEIASGRQAILSWINHNGLIFRGISTPCCLGAILKGNKGYLVFKFLHNTLPLYEFIKENPSQVDRDFIKKLAGFIRNMHLAGVFHKDLKANNILVSKGKDIYIVDIDQVRFVKGVSLAKIIKNLAQLNAGVGSPVCITDRIRFYNFYAGLDFRLNKERKKIIAQIMRITRKRKHVWP
jgi:tRNA A-37 threonylcarbamoyl transferase component Bud32